MDGGGAFPASFVANKDWVKLQRSNKQDDVIIEPKGEGPNMEVPTFRQRRVQWDDFNLQQKELLEKTWERVGWVCASGAGFR